MSLFFVFPIIGPVLGPMVYGCAVFPLSKERGLKELDVDDSNALNEAIREEIFQKMEGDPAVQQVLPLLF